MFRQQRNIFAPLGQSRDMDANDVEAMEEILAEFALCDEVLKVLVGGGNDTDIGDNGLMPADSIEFALCQHSQQASLGRGRHVPDFI